MGIGTSLPHTKQVDAPLTNFPPQLLQNLGIWSKLMLDDGGAKDSGDLGTKPADQSFDEKFGTADGRPDEYPPVPGALTAAANDTPALRLALGATFVGATDTTSGLVFDLDLALGDCICGIDETPPKVSEPLGL